MIAIRSKSYRLHESSEAASTSITHCSSLCLSTWCDSAALWIDLPSEISSEDSSWDISPPSRWSLASAERYFPTVILANTKTTVVTVSEGVCGEKTLDCKQPSVGRGHWQSLPNFCCLRQLGHHHALLGSGRFLEKGWNWKQRV